MNTEKIKSFFYIHLSSNFLKAIIIALIIFFPYLFIRFHLAIGFGDDSSSQIFSAEYFEKHMFSWSQANFGEQSYFSHHLPIYFFALILKKLGLQLNIINQIILFLFQYFFPTISILFLLRKVLKIPFIACIFGTLIYVYNPFHLMVFYSPIYSPILAFFPLAFGYFLETLRNISRISYKGVTRNGLIIALIILISSNAISHIAYATIYFMSFLIFYIYYLSLNLLKKKFKILIKLHFFLTLTFIASLLFNLYWLVNDLSQYVNVFNTVSSGSLRSFNSIAAIYLHEAMRLLGDWAFKANAYYGYYYPTHFHYYTTFGILASYLIIFLIFLPLLKKNKPSFILAMYFFLLCVFILASGSNGIFGGFIKEMFTTYNFLSIFRSPNKFNINIIFIYSVLLAYSVSLLLFKLRDWTKVLVMSLIFISLSYYIYPVITAKNLTSDINGLITSPYQKIPQYYFEAKTYLESKALNQRTLVLPFHGYGITHFWEFGSSQVQPVLSSIVNKRILAVNIDNKTVYPPGLNRLDPATDVITILPPGTRYIVLQRDIDDRYASGKNSKFKKSVFFDNFLLKNNSIINEKNLFTFTSAYLNKVPNDKRASSSIYNELYDREGKSAISIYRVDDKSYTPLFHMTPLSSPKESLEFKELNPTKYRIILHNVSNRKTLIFAETYNHSWKLSPIQNSFRKENETFNGEFLIDQLPNNAADQALKSEIKSYLNDNLISTAQTGESVKFISKNFKGTIQNDNLSYEYPSDAKPLDPVSGSRHFLYQNIFNGWNIDIEKICVSENVCKQNSDGTFNIELNLEFEKQKIFTTAVSISFTSIVVSILFIFYYNHKFRKAV